MEENKYPTPRGKSATKAKAKYNAKAYDQFLITVPKGYKDAITDAAASLGFKSRNDFIVSLIKEKLDQIAN